MHDLGSILRIEAVRPDPAPDSSRGIDARDNDIGIEMSELSGPAAEVQGSHTGDAIENDVAERFVIAWTRWVKDQITVNRGGSSRGCVDDP